MDSPWYLLSKSLDWLLNWDVDTERVAEWSTAFASDDDYRKMVKRIVMSGPYWAGAE